MKVWDQPITYIGADFFGTSDPDAARQILKTKYNDAGIKLMISAFGGTFHPTSAGFDPTTCANELGDFVLSRNLDGVDIDYEDNDAMNARTGATWVITFTNALRAKLPNHIISHAPQAPYFHDTLYGSESYLRVNN